MYKQLLTIVTALTLLGVSAVTAAANIVSIDGSNPIMTTSGANLDLTIVGNFTDTAEVGGFSLNWDPTVLSYTGAVILPPLNDPPYASIDASSAASGVIDSLYVGSFTESATGNFNIATISFTVIGGNGSGSPVNFTTGCPDCAWYGAGATLLAVDYTNGSVQVGAVPVPAAVWLMFSGLLGLVGIGRRSHRV
jgi:hypothetical protein